MTKETVVWFCAAIWCLTGLATTAYWRRRYRDRSVPWHMAVFGPGVFLLMLYVKDIYSPSGKRKGT